MQLSAVSFHVEVEWAWTFLGITISPTFRSRRMFMLYGWCLLITYLLVLAALLKIAMRIGVL